MHNYVLDGFPLGLLNSSKALCKAEQVGVDGSIQAILSNHFKCLFSIIVGHGSNFVLT